MKVPDTSPSAYLLLLDLLVLAVLVLFGIKEVPHARSSVVVLWAVGLNTFGYATVRDIRGLMKGK